MSSTTETSTLPKRDLKLIVVGIILLFCGRYADSAVNGLAGDGQAVLQQAVASIDRIPKTIGGWTSTDSTLSDREVEIAGIDGYIRRKYRDRRTGYTVHLTVLTGKSGPMSVHQPTACFEGVGYSLISGPTPTTVSHNDVASDFHKSSFRQGSTSLPEIVRVFWGWGTDGSWSAPANPRFAFRGEPFLYKLYVTDSWLEDTGRTPLPQIEAFIEEALPTIYAALNQSSQLEQETTK